MCILFSCNLILVSLLSLISVGPERGRSWSDFEEEAVSAWRILEQHSKRLSFHRTETWSTNGAESREVDRGAANIRNGDLQYLAKRVGKETVAVVTGDYGFVLRRQVSNDPWKIVYYGGNRDTVLEGGAGKFGRIVCPPLTPVSTQTMENFLAISGVAVDHVEEVVTGEEWRVVVFLKFPDDPVTIEGTPFKIGSMRYEFDPKHHWVVTGHEYSMNGADSNSSVEYQFDKDGLPIPIRVETTLKRGANVDRITVEFDEYRYDCDESAFEPETYGLPPFKKPANSFGSSSLLWMLGVIILVSTGLWLRSRK